MFIIVMLFFGAGSVQANSSTNASSATHAISVTLEVYDSLGVNLDGKPSTDFKVFTVGNPAMGRVTYVKLDD